MTYREILVSLQTRFQLYQQGIKQDTLEDLVDALMDFSLKLDEGFYLDEEVPE